MTQENKELLLRDLSVRLTYGVKIQVNDKIESIQGINVLDNVVEYDCCLSSGIEEVKPYLFPMSSMTEEQKREYIELLLIGPSVGIDWLNKNHFDYRGLIEKGLAIDATNLNIY